MKSDFNLPFETQRIALEDCEAQVAFYVEKKRGYISIPSTVLKR